MISNKIQRKSRGVKMSKTLERLYKEGKCTECSVVVTRMDFAKILGKFTKVKIQYEIGSPTRSKRSSVQTSPNSNARLKSNENGMVLIHRNAYNQHPIKDILKKPKASETITRNISKENSKTGLNNILKENNMLKKTLNLQQKGFNFVKYGIVFEKPETNNNNETKNKLALDDLLPNINKSILPSDEWCIDFLPNCNEPKEDKVYDRIAAELEDLMNSENTKQDEPNLNKSDDFPSIMDILNDNSTDSTQKIDQSSTVEYKPSLESSDVEAMLLGKSNETVTLSETPIEVENTDMSNLLADVGQLNPPDVCDSKQESGLLDIENPNSPSILAEPEEKEVILPIDPKPNDVDNSTMLEETSTKKTESIELETKKDIKAKQEKLSPPVTHVVFKKSLNSMCYKSVTCPKNLKYSIELEGKPVEFLGAPKLIKSIDDLQVLLQIVNESELDSRYVLCIS